MVSSAAASWKNAEQRGGAPITAARSPRPARPAPDARRRPPPDGITIAQIFQRPPSLGASDRVGYALAPLLQGAQRASPAAKFREDPRGSEIWAMVIPTGGKELVELSPCQAPRRAGRGVVGRTLGGPMPHWRRLVAMRGAQLRLGAHQARAMPEGWRRRYAGSRSIRSTAPAPGRSSPSPTCASLAVGPGFFVAKRGHFVPAGGASRRADRAARRGFVCAWP
jgi:hypothetical protein